MGDFVPLIASSTDRLPVARPALLQFWRRFRGLGLRRVERCRGWISSSRNTLCDRISHRLRIQRVFCQAPIPHLDIRVRKWREIPITLIWPCAGHLVSTVDSLVRYSRDMYVHSEDLPLHLSRISTAAGDWLIAAQNAAQSQNGDTLFLKLIREEVIFT